MVDLREMNGAAAGAGENAALRVAVAEELGFEQVLGQGAALDGLEGCVVPPAGLVNRAGDELLAHAELALQQDRAVVVRHALDEADDLLDGVALADDLGAVRGRSGRRDGGSGGPGGFLPERMFDRALEVGQLEGLGQVVEGAEAHGLDGGFHAAVAGDHDDGGGWQFRAAELDDIQAVHVPDEQVDNDEIGLVLAQGGDAGGAGLAAADLMTERPAEFGHQLQNGRFVINDYCFGHDW